MASLEATCCDSNSLTFPVPVRVRFEGIREIGDLHCRISSSFSCELGALLLAGAGMFYGLCHCGWRDWSGGDIFRRVLQSSSSLAFFLPKPMPYRLKSVEATLFDGTVLIPFWFFLVVHCFDFFPSI